MLANPILARRSRGDMETGEADMNQRRILERAYLNRPPGYLRNAQKAEYGVKLRETNEPIPEKRHPPSRANHPWQAAADPPRPRLPAGARPSAHRRHARRRQDHAGASAGAHAG